MGFKIKNSLTGEFEKLPILTLKGEKGETGGVEEYNKVDYMGNKYETLKQANDANVEYAVKTAIGEFNYLDYDGQHITATDTIEGRSKSAILTGQTLVNLCPDWVIEHTATSDWDGYKSLGQNSATQEPLKVLQDLKPNTKYFISCYVETFNVGEGQGYLLNNPHQMTVFDESLEVRATGLHKWVLTSKSEFTEKVSIALRCQNKNARGAIKIRDIMIIEYQEGMENWDIPYFTGMQSVKLPVLMTHTKNLFDGEIENGVFQMATNGTYPTNINHNKYIRSKNLIRVIKNSTYTISSSVYVSSWYIAFLNSDGYYCDTPEVESLERNVVFTTPKDCVYIRFYTGTSDTSAKIQIENGSKVTEYTGDYKTNILTVNEEVELRGVGDVQDTLDLMTGELTQRIGEIVLDGSQDMGADNQGVYIQANDMKRTLDYINKIKCDKLPVIYQQLDLPNVENGISGYANDYKYLGQNWLYIKINNSIDVDEVKQMLSQNPITVQYELAIESIKTVDLSDNHVYSYKDVTHYDCSSAEGSLIPTLSVKVPTDVQATIAQQRETIQTLNSENERLNQIQEALKASMLDSQVQLMNLSWDTDFEVFTLRESIAPKDFLMASRTGSNIDKFSQAKFIIENDCPDLEKLNSQIEYYFSKDVFSQEQFEELTDLISIVKGENGCEY